MAQPAIMPFENQEGGYSYPSQDNAEYREELERFYAREHDLDVSEGTDKELLSSIPLLVKP